MVRLIASGEKHDITVCRDDPLTPPSNFLFLSNLSQEREVTTL